MTIREIRGDSPNDGVALLQRANDSRCASLFDRLPASDSDLEANNLNRLADSLHCLAFCGREPGSHDAADYIAIEPMSPHKQRFGSAIRAAAE